MKRHLLGLGILISVVSLQSACRSTPPQENSEVLTARPGTLEVPGNFKFDLDMTQIRAADRVTYLTYMKEVVKPGLDDIATNGYNVGDAKAMQATYDFSGPKIKRSIDSISDGGIEHVKKIATALRGVKTNLKTLPISIRQMDKGVNHYAVATFIGLASGGGVKIKYANQNYSMNIHYDTVEKKSGRSFGIGPTGGFNDISDRDYLIALGKYAKDSPDDLGHFYKTVFKTLLNSDTSGYADVNPEGKTLLSNFLAVYTAEQDRNLMDGKVTPYWDAALLEVTLLAGFHANQDQLKLFYWDAKTDKTTFTNKTFKQTPCAAASASKVADMTDYWQFSRNITDPTNCKRSGINITNKQFRQLGTAITTYMTTKHPNLVKAVRSSMSLTGTQPNLFFSLSNFLMSDRTPRKFPAATIAAVTDSWDKFLNAAAEESKSITTWIDRGGGAAAAMAVNSEEAALPPMDDIGDQGEDVEDWLP